MVRVIENKLNTEKDYFSVKAVCLVHDTGKVLNETNTPYQKHTYYKVWVKYKVKVIPLLAVRDPGGWGSWISRQSVHGSCKVVSLMHRPPLPRRKYSWYSFLLETESIQGHSAAESIVSMKNAIDPIGNRTRNLSACSAVPQRNLPPRAPA